MSVLHSYEAEKVELRQRIGNMLSASEKPEVITEYLQNEVEMKCVIHVGYTTEVQELGIHCSPFGRRISPINGG